jgi:hypothetical protein
MPFLPSTYRVSASAAAIRNATETQTANTTETANAADIGAAYRRRFFRQLSGTKGEEAKVARKGSWSDSSALGAKARS